MDTFPSVDDLVDFLNQTQQRGQMPAATAQALIVATRNVFSVLDQHERASLPLDDLDGVITRFNKTRADDFSPGSLTEYARRVRRAVDMYVQWKNDPANFTTKTRNTSARGKDRTDHASSPVSVVREGYGAVAPSGYVSMSLNTGGYQSAFPIRTGHVVTISNIPPDLSAAEADRLAQFIRLLVPASR